MKLKLVSLSAAIILLSTSTFTAAAQAPVAMPSSPSPQPAMQQNMQTPQGDQHQQGQPPMQGQAGNQEEAPVKKKIDPKLQEKLNVKVDDVTEEEYQKVVGEYKKYLRNVPVAVRQEIRDFRKEVININKEKSALYKKLSQEAQKFLAKEREIKRKLPINNQAAFAKEIRHTEAE